ncbi:SSV1 integrase homolog, C-fragment [Thermococcus kodakarensis KOD1]|uniref:SSV1 integrase homolog, C-fragment n=1 Tax=Thermococcus kodakarensis (strain ATCC BAA-918 / JCM 12380 / KOD1) TaxID=69014 RepID=Q5JDM7_THEKO|nr:integrase [Thermococcus kodakarensis]WCN28660.1 integrase [Thermococcus kodakarensis]WCN30958.1 integrase [Thermococcus kodakarensis]BAD84803.1 SSV1 integrase homolog, C-fragment [Thermococcus kodakarensis KOD1]
MNPGRGLERQKGTSSPDISLNEKWSQLQDAYAKWLSLRVSTEETKFRYISTLEKFFNTYAIKTYEDLQEILAETGYKRHITKALRSFAKFLRNRGIITRDQYLDLKEIIWVKPTHPRKVNVPDAQIREALKYYEQKDPILATIYKTLVFSGLRLKAVIELFNEFDPEKLILPREYPNIAKYPIHKQKGQKKAFYAYLPRDFALTELEQLPLDYEHVKNRLRVKLRSVRNTEKSVQFSAAAVREWFATFLARKGCPFEVINFIQGRAERGVLEKHYLNLEILADEWYSSVVDDLKLVLEGGWRSKRAKLGISLRGEEK